MSPLNFFHLLQFRYEWFVLTCFVSIEVKFKCKQRGRLSQSPSHDLDISSGSRTPGLFGLFLGFLPFSIFYRAYISCHYQKY